jgi:hypothetical protein
MLQHSYVTEHISLPEKWPTAIRNSALRLFILLFWYFWVLRDSCQDRDLNLVIRTSAGIHFRAKFISPHIFSFDDVQFLQIALFYLVLQILRGTIRMGDQSVATACLLTSTYEKALDYLLKQISDGCLYKCTPLGSVLDLSNTLPTLTTYFRKVQVLRTL